MWRRWCMLFAVLGSSHAAHAETEACVSAYDESQRARRRGALIEARDKLVQCAQQTCPEAIVKECTQWLAEVRRALPSVVLGAKDAAGKDVISVEVYDGEQLLTRKLDGRALNLDPGSHELRFVFPGGEQVREAVLVRESEQNRVVTARLPGKPASASAVKEQAPRDPAPRQATRPAEIPTASYVLAAVGAVALGSFAYFGIRAQQDSDDLDARCSPNCPTADTDAVKQKALIADISLGVGLVSLAAGGYLWLSAEPSPSSAGWVRGLRVGGHF